MADEKDLKTNFHVATYQYAEYFDEAMNVKTRLPHLELRLPFTDTKIQGNINCLYYVNLATPHIPEADFSVGMWYTDEAIAHVEGAFVGFRKLNLATKMRQINVVRGRMSKISQDRMFPDGANIPISGDLDIRQLSNLYADRNCRNFMMHSYLITVNLIFNSDWKKLGDGKQTALLTALDKHADNLFPGVVDTVILETPLSITSHALLIYADTYLDVESYVNTIKSTTIAPYLEDTSQIMICNHTEIQNIENPKNQVRRS